MKNILSKLSFLVVICVLFAACNNTLQGSEYKIKSEWKNESKYDSQFGFGLIFASMGMLCNNSKSLGSPNHMDVLYNVLNNTPLKNPKNERFALCWKKIMSKYTPMDYATFIKNSDKDKIQEMRKFGNSL